MADKYEVITEKVISELEASKNIRISDFYLFKSKMFSQLFVLESDDGQEFVLKIGTTVREINDEYEFYIMLNRLQIKSLTPVFFSAEYNALVTEKKDITPLFVRFRKLGRRDAFPQIFRNIGKLCRVLEEKSRRECELQGGFAFASALEQKMSSCFFMPPRLMRKVKDWLVSHQADLNRYGGEEFLSTDLNFFNLHVTKDDELVLVDMGDTHYLPRGSNLAYLFLQFHFNRPKHCMIKKDDFDYLVEGYNDKAIEKSLVFSYFKIYHLIDTMDFYQLLVNRMPKFKGIFALLWYRIFYVRPLIRELKKTI
jgi:hypothetical protein